MPQESIFATGFGQQLLQTACGREIAARDWSATPLGPYDGWPRSLKAIVQAVLACPTPIIFAWGPELTTFFNDAYRPIFGTRAETAMGGRFRELWHEILDDLGPLIDGALAGQSHKAVDMHLAFTRDALPTDSWWTFTTSPLWDDDDALCGLMIVTMETTERVLAARMHQAASERLRKALSAGDRIGAWDWDVPNDLVYANAQFALIYCVEPERAAAGAPVQDFLGCIHPDDLVRVQSEIAQAMAIGERYCSEYRIVGRNGSNLWVSAQGQPVLDEDGRCVRFPGLSFDITANKKAELAI